MKRGLTMNYKTINISCNEKEKIIFKRLINELKVIEKSTTINIINNSLLFYYHSNNKEDLKITTIKNNVITFRCKEEEKKEYEEILIKIRSKKYYKRAMPIIINALLTYRNNILKSN